MKNGQSYTFEEIKDKLAYYCAYQDRCQQEVERKMKDFLLIPEAKDAIWIYLIENDFVNEERFAKSFVRGKFYQKKWGKRKIVFELKKRNIPDKLISIALLEIDEDDYFESLQNLVSKKNKEWKSLNSKSRKTKITRFLFQKGFDYEDIKQVLNPQEE